MQSRHSIKINNRIVIIVTLLVILILTFCVWLFVYSSNSVKQESTSNPSSSQSSLANSSSQNASNQNISQILQNNKSETLTSAQANYSPPVLTQSASSAVAINLTNLERKIPLDQPINQKQILVTVKNGFSKADYFATKNFNIEDCNEYINSNPNPFELYKISPSTKNEYILRIGCEAGAYNYSYIFVYFQNSVKNPTNLKILPNFEFNKMQNKFEKATNSIAGHSIFVNVFNYDYLKFSSFFKLRGLGDCGVYQKHQIVLEKLAIYTVKSQTQETCLLDTFNDGSSPLTEEQKKQLNIENWPVEYSLID